MHVLLAGCIRQASGPHCGLARAMQQAEQAVSAMLGQEVALSAKLQADSNSVLRDLRQLQAEAVAQNLGWQQQEAASKQGIAESQASLEAQKAQCAALRASLEAAGVANSQLNQARAVPCWLPGHRTQPVFSHFFVSSGGAGLEQVSGFCARQGGRSARLSAGPVEQPQHSAGAGLSSRAGQAGERCCHGQCHWGPVRRPPATCGCPRQVGACLLNGHTELAGI